MVTPDALFVLFGMFAHDFFKYFISREPYNRPSSLSWKRSVLINIKEIASGATAKESFAAFFFI